MQDLRVALVHHWLVKMRGAERVLEQFCRLFPRADIYTLVAEPARLSPLLRERTIHTSFVQRLPRATRWYPYYLPFMPCAFEGLDLRGHDLVLTSDAGLAKCVIAPADAVHVCYCHSPPRYLWNMFARYLRDECGNPLKRLAFQAVAHRLRLADFCAAGRVDTFIANSRTVRCRISRYYAREAEVIHPPVELDRFRPGEETGDYYLVVSQLNAYKQVDLAVRAFNRLGKRLVVAGDGPERRRLERLAGHNVEFRGFVDGEALPDLYARCRALIFPGEEDFGITPLEAHACGRPVIALRAGGVTETVLDGETGLFFDEPTPDALAAAVEHFESVVNSFDAGRIRSRAEEFSPARFRRDIREAVRGALEAGRAAGLTNAGADG
ncbi:MAG: glycosyltransferase [Candidatus Brocadiia bacterium]